MFSVDLFFSLALAAGMISKDRPSNKVDIAFALPAVLSVVSASMDKLHARTAPLFMTVEQRFVWGADLKSELTRLDEHYWSTLTDEEKARGVMAVAHRPPLDEETLTTRLWDQFMSPNWRKPREPVLDPPEKAARDGRFELMDQLKDAAPAVHGVDLDTADYVIVESKVPARMGRWQVVQPASEDKPSDRFRPR